MAVFVRSGERLLRCSIPEEGRGEHSQTHRCLAGTRERAEQRNDIWGSGGSWSQIYFIEDN